jgi:5,10-methylenetetrahydrofolate reductase
MLICKYNNKERFDSMENIEKLQELLNLIENKANSTPAEKLAVISVVGERYKEIFDVDIMNMLLERIMWQIEGDIVELDYIGNIDCDDLPF